MSCFFIETTTKMFFEIFEKKYFIGACRYFETNQNQLAIYHIFFLF